MDTRTGEIYESIAAAEKAGVPREHLVTGQREALERLSAMIKERGSFKNFSPGSGSHGTDRRFCGNRSCVDCAEAQTVAR